jgi:hypothetical protein
MSLGLVANDGQPHMVAQWQLDHVAHACLAVVVDGG